MASSLVSNMLGQYSEYFAVFGAVAASFIAIKFLFSCYHSIRSYILARPLGLGVNFKKLGKWAVVTGSTDGIGKAYAEQLAKKGMNIVLISRSKDKLENVSKEIEAASGVQTKYIVADFSRGESIYAGIRQELQGLDIGVLVNNVGLGYKFPEYFLDIEDRDKFFMNLINVNMTSVTLMTSVVLPGMVERKRGAILNISSGSGMFPVPLLSVYSATKAYVDFLSVTLNKEYESMGIHIQSVMPFFVTTKLSGIRRSSSMIPNPTSYVKSSLSLVGVNARTNGFWSHELQGFLTTGLLPREYMLNIMSRMMKSARKTALKKLQSKKSN